MRDDEGERTKIAGVAALGKAIGMLNVVANAPHPMRFADLLTRTELPKATLHRILSALIDHGLLRIEERDRTYRLGLRLFELAHKVWADFDVRGAAEPELIRLRELTGETIHLGMLDGTHIVHIDQVETAQQIRLSTGVGRRQPLHSTAIGKAILAFLHAAEQKELLARLALEAETPATLTDLAALKPHLDLARATGYAIEVEEHAQGVSGVAAPILDPRGRAIAAIGLSGPSFRLPPEKLHGFGPDLIEAARRATRNAGGFLVSVTPQPNPHADRGAEARCVLPATALLGEGPVWSVRDRALWWVDILAPAIHRFDPAAGTDITYPMPELVGALAVRAKGGLLVALQSGIAAFDPASGALEMLARPEADRPSNRFNDGKCDRRGRFWAGTLDIAPKPGTGSLYRLNPDGSVVRADFGFTIANGMGWSPDDSRFYFSDSGQLAIFQYDFDPERGEIGNRRLFAEVPQGDGMPDGITVDEEGHVWVAHWDGWCVRRYDPRGKVERTVTLPVPRPTSIMFGGPDLKTLYVTSARIRLPAKALADAPQSGSIFAFEPGMAGLPEPAFAG